MAAIRKFVTDRGSVTGRRNAQRLLAAGTAALAAVALLSPPGLAAVRGPATSTWSVLPSPEVTAPQGKLNGVSCTSATACMAVGTAVSSTGAEVALAERWNGTSWAILNVPNPAITDSLSGVSCTSASACTAVGFSSTDPAYQHPLAERWDGTTWTVQPTPAAPKGTGSYLLAVSCASATVCTAVGAYRDVPEVQTLAERWNGTKWALQPTANANGFDSLSAVSCPSASTCLAVGSASNLSDKLRALAERWNGTKWAIQRIPNPAGSASLSAVSCPSSSVCTAVGGVLASPNSALAERWNGTKWAIQATPTPADGGSLSGVSCPSATACTAVGSYDGAERIATLAEVWNGTKWAIQATPGSRRGQLKSLAGVSCPSPAACAAAGSNGSTAAAALAEAWNGVHWAIQRSRSPAGPLNTSLTGISCASAAACAAVGSADENPANGSNVSVAEAWNGTRWVIEPTPKVPGARTGYLARSELSAVSCPSATACTAVGYYFAPHGDFGYNDGLAERWNGTAWVVQPLPTSAEFSPLTGVSCTSATACTAVGTFFNLKHSTPYQVLAERWNGTKWTVQAAPTPAGSATVGGVSCTSATACTLVGSYESGDNQFTLAERWDGTKWSIQPTPNPAGSTESYLTAVSCSSPAACTAVGYASGTKQGSVNVTLAERWNGTTWSIQPTPNQNVAINKLDGVSCVSPTECTAVGGPLAAAWNGSTWQIQKLAVPAGAGPGDLSGVYCQSAVPCTAAGDYSTGVVRPLIERRS